MATWGYRPRLRPGRRVIVRGAGEVRRIAREGDAGAVCRFGDLVCALNPTSRCPYHSFWRHTRCDAQPPRGRPRHSRGPLISKIDDKYYQAEYWLEGAWYDAWVGDLSPTYWRIMVDATLKNFLAWVAPGERAAYLESETGRNQTREQLFVRMSQASGNFIPWLSERRDLQGQRVLEIGSGTGSSTAALCRAGAVVTGIDIAEPYLRTSRIRLDALGLNAELRCAPMQWLASAETASQWLAPSDPDAPFDLIVCYALLEHLLPAERLNLLSALRPLLQARPDTWLVIYETPNRFAPRDWHSTHLGFPDVLPDEIAQAFLQKRLADDHPWRSGVGTFHTDQGRETWFRHGRGVSFHEFDITLGLENIFVVQDGYSERCEYIRHLRPNAAYEAGLAEVFASLEPPVPRGFCRPTLDLVLKWKVHAHFDDVPADSEAVRSVFEAAFRTGWWGSQESKSGKGSELATTEVLRVELETWLADHPEIVSIFDAPCGDFNWMRAVNWPHPVRYTGGDIVGDIIVENNQKFAADNRHFIETDIINNIPPAVDLWLCRDALIHMPFQLATRAVEQFCASDIRFFLSTTFPAETNELDCRLGEYHKVNLAIAPFNLGPPECLLRDPAENDQKDRYIGVWRNPKFRNSTDGISPVDSAFTPEK